MLSKVLRRSDAIAVEPYLFPPTAGSRPHARQPESRQPDAPLQDPGPLQQRIAALELQLTQQAAAIRQTALREGEAQGRARAEAALKPVGENLARTIQQLFDSKPILRKQIEEEAVQLSLAIARRILRRELSIDPTALSGLVQAAFERVARQETTRVIVHPDQAVPVRAALAAATTRNIEIVSDAARESGTLIFETTRGSIDASVDSQLREIELGLADRLKHH